MGFIKRLAWTVPAVTATAATGSVATSSGTESRWYRKLDKPPFQPPAPVFPIAWTALYASIAGSAAAVEGAFDAAGDGARPSGMAGSETADAAPVTDRRRAFRAALGLNLVLNALWSWMFFRWRRLPESTVVAGALAVSTADLARRAAREKSAAGAALVPYAGWTTFATVLTAAIWRRNPRS